MKSQYSKKEQPCTIQNVGRSFLSYSVTGTFHGSIVEAESEGEARGIFHKYYKGESITHIRKRGNLPAWIY